MATASIAAAGIEMRRRLRSSFSSLLLVSRCVCQSAPVRALVVPVCVCVCVCLCCERGLYFNSSGPSLAVLHHDVLHAHAHVTYFLLEALHTSAPEPSARCRRAPPAPPAPPAPEPAPPIRRSKRYVNKKGISPEEEAQRRAENGQSSDEGVWRNPRTLAPRDGGLAPCGPRGPLRGCQSPSPPG